MLLFLLPLILALATNNFIKREAIHYGQPDVKFTNELIIEALINDGTINTVKQFSTIADINTAFTNKIENPQLSVLPYDRNGDLKAEDLTLEFEFFHQTTESVKSINILFELQYYIGNDINTQFKTLVYKTINAPSGGQISFARFRGDLILKQKNPIAEGTTKRELYNTTLKDDYNNDGISGMLSKYVMRNQTTEYKAEPLVSSLSGTSSTKIIMDIRIPAYESIWYYPSVLQVIKTTWIEYFALLIPIYFILYVWMYGFIVKSGTLS